MTTLTLKLPEPLAARLAKLAKRRGVSRSQLVREAIEHTVNTVADAGAPSCLDLARDLVGSHEGPATLSSDKRHLKGYGR